MRHYSLLRLKNIPEIEEEKALNFSPNSFSTQDQIFFAREIKNQFMNISLVEPDFVMYVPSNHESHIHLGPHFDITSTSPKIKHTSQADLNILSELKTKDIVNSFAVHIFVLVVYIVFNFLTSLNRQEPKVIEISFGLTDALTQTQQEVTTKAPEGQTEATKTIQDLPQLIKNTAPDQAPKPSEENNVAKTEASKDFVFHDEKKSTPPDNQVKSDLKAKNIGKEIPKKQDVIDEKDYLKRKEEDLRKVALEKKQGVHGKNLNTPDGQKNILNSLPKSPFQSSEDIPQAPPGLAPMGEESGVNVANYNSYRLYIKNQLRMNWNTNEGASFSNKLKCVVEFTINAFGYLLGEPKIIQSSGNKDFDNIVKNSLQGVFPVSTPPPKSIHPPQTFKATYSAKSVN